MKKKFLITGCAGFIGMHTCLSLLKKKYLVIGIDNLNNYYEPTLKKSRLNVLKKYKNFFFYKLDLNNLSTLKFIYKKHNCNNIIHLAAQAGVRYSFIKPKTYLKNNVNVFLNILEISKLFKPDKLIYASSSSVYGSNTNVPFKESDNTDRPISVYAATKKMNELMANVYTECFKINSVGIRFFTVYGPFGRPDMALFLFVKNILKKKPIKIFNYGNMIRDFTYIDDVICKLEKIIFSKKLFRNEIFNMGNHKPITLKKFIKIIENKLQLKAIKKYLDIQMGDVGKTISSTKKLKLNFKIKKYTSPEIGISRFIDWYKSYYH